MLLARSIFGSPRFGVEYEEADDGGQGDKGDR
jgi:hypothetical protein